MSDNGKDDAKDKTVNFDSLELDEGDESSQQMTQLLTYLKENMEPEKYAEVMTLLGIGKDMSNTDLFEKLKGLFAKKPEEEEEEDPEKKKDELAAEEGEEKPDKAAFMKACMAEGKDIATCTEEFNKKYPEPAEKAEKADELAKVPEEVKAELKKQADRITELEGQKELGEISQEVEKLVTEKHLAPVQRDAIIQLSAKMTPEDRGELLGFFRTTQKLDVHRDKGVVASLKPGEVAGNDLSTERKKELIELHGLSGLLMDKGDRSRPWAKELDN